MISTIGSRVRMCLANHNRFLSRSFSTAVPEEEYFEEYVEHPVVENIKKSADVPFQSPSSSTFLEDVIGALTKQKAKDLVVVRTEDIHMSPYHYKIICSAYNSRQAAAISENLRSLMKLEGNTPVGQAKMATKRSSGWYVSEIEQIQVHVMNEECRSRYDLELMWAGDENIRQEIDDEKNRILFPPKRTNF